MTYSNARKARYNKRTAFDAALDALRTGGLTQTQYSNLQGGMLPGGFKGLFLGMTPDQLKQIASFVDPQGTATDSGKIDPITGAPLPGAMHFNYNDPRLQHGEAADETATVAPWLQAAGSGGVLPVRTPGGGDLSGGGRMPPGLINNPGLHRGWTGLGAHGYGHGHHGVLGPAGFRQLGQGMGRGGYPVRKPPVFRFQQPGSLPFRTVNGPRRPVLGGGGGLRQQLIANALRMSTGR